MLEGVWQHLTSFGVAGLLFVMWWYERQERVRNVSTLQHAGCKSERLLEVNEQLLGVIRSNTEAFIALREELRAHRENEREWMSRLSHQLEALEIP